jgi:multicomponent Na+:H+ antiporter subunit C
VEAVTAHLSYWVAIALMMAGLYAVVAKSNLVKKTIGLGLFHSGVFLLFILMAWQAPDDAGGAQPNPLPHALILTAVLVSAGVTAVALAISVGVRERYGSVDTKDLRELYKEED